MDHASPLPDEGAVLAMLDITSDNRREQQRYLGEFLRNIVLARFAKADEMPLQTQERIKQMLVATKELKITFIYKA